MPKRAVFERSRRELSLDVSVGVHIDTYGTRAACSEVQVFIYLDSFIIITVITIIIVIIILLLLL